MGKRVARVCTVRITLRGCGRRGVNRGGDAQAQGHPREGCTAGCTGYGVGQVQVGALGADFHSAYGFYGLYTSLEKK